MQLVFVMHLNNCLCPVELIHVLKCAIVWLSRAVSALAIAEM